MCPRLNIFEPVFYAVLEVWEDNFFLFQRMQTPNLTLSSKRLPTCSNSARSIAEDEMLSLSTQFSSFDMLKRLQDRWLLFVSGGGK